MKVKRSRYYHKLFLYGIISGLIPTIIITLSLYGYASSIILRKVNDNAFQALSQVQNRMDQLLQMQDRQALVFLSSAQTQEFMAREIKTTDFVAVRNVMSALNQILMYDLGITDASLQSRNNGWKLTLSGFYPDQADRDHPAYGSAPHVSWRISPDGNSIMLTRTYPLNASASTGLLQVAISKEQMRQTLAQGTFPGHLFVIDENGGILLDGGRTGEKTPALAYLQGLPVGSFSERTSTFDASIGGRSYTISHIGGAYGGWRYVAVTDTQALLHELRTLQWITILVSIGLLLIIAAYVLLFSRHMYAPLRALYQKTMPASNGAKLPPDEFHAIDDTLRQQGEQSLRLFTYQVLSGELDEKSIEGFCATQSVPFVRPGYVCLMRVDAIESTDDETWLMPNIDYMVKEEISALLALPPVVMRQGYAMVLHSMDELGTLVEMELTGRFHMLQNHIRQIMNIEVSICASCPIDSLAQCCQALLQANMLFEQQVKHGRSAVLFAHPESDGTGLNSAVFYSSALSYLVAAVRAQKRDEALLALDRLMDELFAGDVSSQTLLFICSRMLIDCLDAMGEFDVREESLALIRQVSLKDLYNLKGREQVVQWFRTTLIEPAIDILQRKQSESDMRIYMRAKELIQQNVEADYTVEQCAEQIKCSVNALQRSFKNIVNMTFSGYLMHWRMEVCKQWLRETDMLVADIAQRLCYSNAQNFVRSFRRHEGMTPGEYRKMSR